MKSAFVKSFLVFSLAALFIGSPFQVFASSGTSSTLTKAPETQYTGFLIDSRCGTKGFDDFHKIDLKKNPENHTTDCMKMKECMGSGLGISLRQADGTYKFFKFDAKSSKLADDQVMMLTKKKADIMVTVKGTLTGDTMTVSSIIETPEYTGFLIDNHCGVKGFDDFHKINLKKNPEMHTAACMKMMECMGSGVGISLKQVDSTYKFYKFDVAGSKLADNKVMMLTNKKFNIRVTAKGSLNVDTITLSSIKEAQ